MVIENRPIPKVWTNKPTYLKILKKVLKNEEMKNIAFENLKNNFHKEKYNNQLKENLPKILDKCKSSSSYEYDNDLMTLVDSKKSKVKATKRFKSLEEEYNDMIKKQNTIIEPPKPDSIKCNLKNILDYRKKIALRFKYNNYNQNNNNLNMAIHKSKSQIINPKESMNYDTASTGNDNKKTIDIKKIINYSYRNNSKYLKNNFTTKEKTIKEYEEIFMITGMNNKKFKDNNIIKEKNINENNKINENMFA